MNNSEQAKKKVLITGGRGMLAYNFLRTQSEKFEIIPLNETECDITSFESILQAIAFHEPDVLLNLAAYTAVDEAENMESGGNKLNYDVNTLGTYNLAKATSAFGVGFITISTDYVFDGKKKEGYLPNDTPNPIGAYGMSKYLGETLAFRENAESIIVRTSWLYGGGRYQGDMNASGVYKNFVNTMLRLAETKSEVRVVNDQFGIPTSCIALSEAIAKVIEGIEDYTGRILHFSGASGAGGISWCEFAEEIFRLSGVSTKVFPCSSDEYVTRAKRPENSVLLNDSDIVMGEWKEGLGEYLN